MSKTYRPRGDFIIIRQEDRGKVRGLHMPDQAAEGKRLVVVAIGPDVQHLEPGDEIVITVAPDNVARIPGEGHLYLTRQANAAAVVDYGEEEE